MNQTPDEAEPSASPPAPIKTYSLEEVAAMVLPPELKDGRRWLAHRLNLGQIRGYKVGRNWRMTEAQVHDMIEGFSNKIKEPPPPIETPAPTSIIDGLSERSRRRLMRRDL